MLVGSLFLTHERSELVGFLFLTPAGPSDGRALQLRSRKLARMVHRRASWRPPAMFLASRCSHERFLKRCRHTQSIAILSAVLLCGTSCAKPLRGTASIVGVRNTRVESSRPSVRRPAEPVAVALPQRRPGTVTPRPSGPGRSTESPRALGTSGVASTGASRPPQPASAPTSEPGAEATVGQTRVPPGPDLPGDTRTAADERGTARSIAFPVGIMALVGVLLVTRRWW